MLLLSRPWIYTYIVRRAYITSTTKYQLEKQSRIDGTRTYVSSISTLRPENLVHSDFLVFAGKQRPAFCTKASLRGSPTKTHARSGLSIPIVYQSYSVDKPDGAKHDAELEGDSAVTTISGIPVKRGPTYVPFPEHTRGFLYLHQPQPESGLPRSASSIRFRCVSASVEAPSSVFFPPAMMTLKPRDAFNAGHDLTLLSGAPWDIPIVIVAGRPSFENVRMLLLEDGLLSRSELQEYEHIYKNTNFSRRSNFLRTLDDAFLIKFGVVRFMVWTATAKDEVLEEKRERVSQATPEGRSSRAEAGSSVFTKVFMEKRNKYRGKLPYTGSAYVRFELAPGSSPSKLSLSLRIVKIIEPVKCVIPDYDGFIHMPKEGELVSHGYPGKSKLWICPLNPSIKCRSSILALVPGYTKACFS